MTTALYLAHLNPVTNAHVEIIQELLEQADTVKVMPVVFRCEDHEVNSKSFPFDFNTRKSMLESVFNNTINITDDYTFTAPFKRYFPPLLAPKSWELRRKILHDIDGEFFSYTGDKTEGLMLKIYRLHPKIGERRKLAASAVKAKMYKDALDGDDIWSADVPDTVVDIIRNKWNVIKRYAQSDDTTRRIAGMKFPKEGWS